MTDKEIIKALECHSVRTIAKCQCCPYRYDGECGHKMTVDALDLINRLETENENYSHNIKKLTESNMKAQAEIERLTEENLILPSKAYKEFAEKLKEESWLRAGVVPWYEIQEIVDNLVKEMVGEK